MTEAARIVIRRLDWQRMLRLDRSQFDEEFADVAHFARERLGTIALQQMAVLLEHRTAAAGIVDDGVELTQFAAERDAVGVRQLLRRRDQAGVIVQSAA